MRVSVIMPAWKRRFLRRAIESVLSQEFRDFELVVVDDASPEGLGGVVRGFADPRLVYRRNEANIGGGDLAAAWNCAMGHARGDLSVLASDDDEYDPAFLGEMVRLADGKPGVDVFHCRVAYRDAEARESGASELRAGWESAVEFMYNRCVRRMRQCAPEFPFRTEALRAIGGFVPFPRAWHSDDATWMSLARRGGVAYTPRPLLRWRSSPENISSQFEDAAEKIEASELFREWAHAYLAGLEPQSESEREMLARAHSGVGRGTDHLSLWVLRHAGLKGAARAVAGLRGGVSAKCGFLVRMAAAAARRVVGA